MSSNHCRFTSMRQAVSKFMSKIKHYLGVDYGEQKVGLAIADGETKIAFAYSTLKNNGYFWDNLGEIIKKEQIDMLVVGIPSHINREKVVYPGESFAEKAEQVFKIKIAFQDEMFTTKMAKKNLLEKGMRAVNQHDDSEAARIILQSWLDRNHAR